MATSKPAAKKSAPKPAAQASAAPARKAAAKPGKAKAVAPEDDDGRGGADVVRGKTGGS
ncbi:hypothetical protein [Inhella sp.]|uniref:hypothetical protein n=1 Tax=Inhella sp. TaxID=1921806 RepID=UPI0035B3E56D